jgi:hypothetical protein
LGTKRTLPDGKLKSIAANMAAKNLQVLMLWK